MSGDIVYRDGLATSLSEIAQALGSIDGVESAQVRSYDSHKGCLIVGVLTVNDDSELTPGDVISHVRSSFPEPLWPDQVLLTYQSTFGASRRRAA